MLRSHDKLSLQKKKNKMAALINKTNIAILKPLQYMSINKSYIQNALADLGGMPGAHPPMGPNSFIFAHIFTEKHLHWRSTLMGACSPPNGKSCICH